jgi:hypothetical protein
MKKVVLPLLGAGLTPEAVFVQLRAMYEADVTDREIQNLIEWALQKNPQPCGTDARDFSRSLLPERVTAEQAIANTDKWLGVFCCADPTDPLHGQPWRCDECDLWHASP